MTAPKSVGQNRVIRAEWKVVDQSGVEIGVVLWQETAESWCEAVKVGDVIFLGGKETPTAFNCLSLIIPLLRLRGACSFRN